MSPVNVNAIGAYIREQREQAKISLRQLAQAAGVSNPYLSQVERGLRRPSADILQQIAKGLRISAEALYVQAGILDDKPGDTSVTDAIMADTEITERQKQMLIDIYESFRKEVRADAGSRADERDEPDEPADELDEPTAAGQQAAGGEPSTDPVVEAVAAAEAERWSDPSTVDHRATLPADDWTAHPADDWTAHPAGDWAAHRADDWDGQRADDWDGHRAAGRAADASADR